MPRRRVADRITAPAARGVDFSVVRRAAPVHKGASPVRTCIGCRKRAPASQLLRFVAVGTGAELRLLPDPARRLPGRGAHVHPDPACFALAERRRAFGRALRLTGVADTGPLAEHVRAASAPPGTTDGGALGPTRISQGRTTDMSTR
ncbi:YlxR family protein [Krasilnikovia sp. M28-CT-15]|uniref:YlxR family protein n=1 Tax=Krasilnikovia sp. M28-CT-15 TaxID=3373540 RepID=UPI00399C98C5